MPGDWTINAAADAVLEELLVDGGFEKQVTEGFQEFVSNEEDRYGAGMAGRLAREDREGLAQEIRNLQELADERGDELAKLKADAGIAGQQARANSDGLTKQIQGLRELADEREAELSEFRAAAPVNSRMRKLVAELLGMLAEKPDVMAMLKRVPVLRELISSLASLVGVKLDFGPTTKTDALVPVTVEFGTAKSPPEKAGNAKKSALVHPELVVDPGIGN
jgi:hypothetical protein